MERDSSRRKWKRTMSAVMAPRPSEAEEEAVGLASDGGSGGGDEYTVEEVHDLIGSSRGSLQSVLADESRRASGDELLLRFVFRPDNGWYETWMQFIMLWAVYSSFFTPLEFGFFRGLPKNLIFLDMTGQVAFLVDIIVNFFLAYRDSLTYRMIYSPTSIAFRYLKSSFVFDFLACVPWDYIYKLSGRKEEVRYLLWIRLIRVRKVTDFFQRMEKDIRINYLFTRIVKLIVVELYCTHTAACIFYYLATTLPASMEEYTWIGSLKLGDYSYSHFREIDLWRRYITSLYFAIVTMATVGYGDIHAVNTREMVFIMIYVSFDMILGAYLIGNMTALIVKGSKTERFRDKMKDLLNYMNRNKLGKEIRDQIKGHVRLQYESNYTEASILQDIPISIRAKISQTLYRPYIEKVPLFKGCSTEFVNQIVIRLQEEFFLPGEVLLEQGNAVDQLYFVCYGVLEGITIGEDGSEETVLLLEPNSSFGEISILCNIPQPYAIRVRELCRLLRLDKQLFANIMEIYFVDGRTILSNLIEENESNGRIKHLESDITFHIGKQEAALALQVNSATYYGDLLQLKGLIKAGADPKNTDYDGRSPLHLAASRGFEDITSFLIQECVDINASDNFGNTPLFEAVKNGHDKVASLLYSNGAKLNLKDPSSHLCSAVARGDSDFIKRLLAYGIDLNLKDYDSRTPLHVAASVGFYAITKMLSEAGASVFSVDRWGNTPLDEAMKCGSESMVMLLEDAKSQELSKFPERAQELQEKMESRRRCTVFPYHPRDLIESRKEGVMLWIPHTLEELINSSQELLNCSVSRLLSEEGGRILPAGLITDNLAPSVHAQNTTTTSDKELN
ncbi:potassium channel KOR1-like [Zingiber officinale]|uniref:potassium channel KOR1-like n=1 Tax=Zingiber officinale TaxID=94328 RepID=UPI001C4B6CE1|nr:potassium channel KOR1-like [Zingiber officinale]